MTALKYTKPRAFRTPLRKGDVVIVRDRDLNRIGSAVVKRAGKTVVTTVDGRRWRANDGWYVGEHGTYPFPSIARPTRESALSSPRQETGEVKERDAARDTTARWVRAMSEQYPLTWAMDPTNPELCIGNIVRFRQDQIDQLRLSNERMERALKQIADNAFLDSGPDGQPRARTMPEIALEALKNPPESGSEVSP